MESTQAKEVCPTTTQKWIKKGALLVDVREWNEVNQVAFDVPNIMVIPLSEFEERYIEVPKDKDVILVCQVGVLSLKATYFLMNHGYTNVMNMEYGMEKWIKKGFPIKGSPIQASQNTDSCCYGSESTSTETSCCGTSSKEDRFNSDKIEGISCC
jgi:rhodanese-related sulfurtransferase